MTADCAVDLAGPGVTAVAQGPPASATERMVATVGRDDNPTASANPVFNGRVSQRSRRHPTVPPEARMVFAGRALAEELRVVEGR